MKRVLQFAVTAGRLTCASAPRIFCPYVGRNMKGEDSCQLFRHPLEDVDGWLQRLPECLAAEIGDTGET